jgi:hypothetical protein
MLVPDTPVEQEESARLSARAWKDFARGAFRFVCAAAIIAAIEIYRRRSLRMLPFDPRVIASMISFGVAGVTGLLILWRSRRDAVREVLDSSAMLGFWTGFLALFA